MRSRSSNVFPGIWERFAYLAQGRDLIAPDEVHEEIKKKDGGLAEWLKTKPGMFVPLDGPVQTAAIE